MASSLYNAIYATQYGKQGAAALDYALKNASESDRQLIAKLRDPKTTPQGKQRLLDQLRKSGNLTDQQVSEFKNNLLTTGDIVKGAAYDAAGALVGGLAGKVAGKALGAGGNLVSKGVSKLIPRAFAAGSEVAGEGATRAGVDAGANALTKAAQGSESLGSQLTKRVLAPVARGVGRTAAGQVLSAPIGAGYNYLASDNTPVNNDPNAVDSGGNSTGLPAVDANGNPTSSNGVVGAGGTGTGVGGTGTGVDSVPQSLGVFMGKEYFDPSELYHDQLAYLDSVYGTNLSQLRASKQTALDEYGRQKTAQSNSLADILKGYGDQQKTGLSNIAGYYGGLGDIYQSSQGGREQDLLKQITDATTRTQNQAGESQAAIDRNIATANTQGIQGEQQLAGQYQTSKDAISNSVVSDLGSRLGVQKITASGVPTDLTPTQINTNNDLINNLQGLKSSQQFANPFKFGTNPNGQLDTNAILQYLAGVR